MHCEKEEGTIVEGIGGKDETISRNEDLLSFYVCRKKMDGFLPLMKVIII